MIRHFVLALLTILFPFQMALWQRGTGSGNAGGGGGSQVSVMVNGPVSIVMGETATFVATADTPQPSPFWSAKCTGCTVPQASRNDASWTGMTIAVTIADCIGSPGTYTYSCEVI